MTSIFLMAGEASGDLLGSRLMLALKELDPSAKLWGVGGPKIRKETFDCVLPMEDFQMMGFKDCLLKALSFIRQFQTLRNHILERKPDIVTLIDYPGFNLRLAKSLRKRGYRGKIVQYVSPTVWVWGKKRIDVIAKYYDQLLCIFPFEPPLYAHTGLDARYVGHPALEAPFPKTSEESNLLALFPGSREAEIRSNFTLQLKAAKALTQKYPDLSIGVSCSLPQYRPLIDKIISRHSMQKLVKVEDEAYALMHKCHTALAKSGTVTLELALFNKPAAIVYQVDSFNRFIAKHLVRPDLKHVGIVNILAKKTVQPEFVIEPFKMEELIASVDNLIGNQAARSLCFEGYRHIKDLLGTKNASREAARAIFGKGS